MADLVPMSQAATTSLVTTLQNTDLFALAREDNTSETGYRSKVSRVDALAKKVVNETDYSQLQTTDKKIIGAINEVNTKASQFDNMTATASGSIATFDNGGDDIPVSEFECEIVAQQASGTPTPDNPLAITGHSESNIVVCGKNFVPMTVASVKANNTLGTWSGNAYTFNNVVFTLQTDTDGNITGISANGTANATSQLYIATNFTLQKGSYILNGCPSGGGTETARLQVNTGALNIDTGSGANFTLTEVYNSCHCFIRIGSGYNPNGMLFKPMVRLASDTDTFVISKTNLYTVSFGQTIYGGRLIYNGQWSIEATHICLNFSDLDFSASNPSSHVFRGDYSGIYKNNIKFPPDSITATTAITEHYEAMAWQPISSSDNGKFATNDYGTIARFVFIDNNYSTQSDFETARANDKLVVPIITPVIIPLTSSTRVKTISGDNNIFSNTGDCELKYFTNKADSLAELIKAFVV